MDNPMNLDVEEALIGAVLINPQVVSELADVVTDGDFYWMPYGQAWRAIVDITDRGGRVDYLTVCDEMRRAALPISAQIV